MDALQSLIDGLYLEHRRTLIKMLLRFVGCPETAEDLSQEAYLKVSSAIKDHAIDYPRPFLYRTAKNLALDHLRKEKVRRRTLDERCDETETLHVADASPSPENAVAAAQEVDRLLTILSTQPRRRREILVLHKVHGWRYDEIAAHFGISRSAVEKNIRIALAHCLAAKDSDAV